MTRSEVDLYEAIDANARARRRTHFRVEYGRRVDLRPLFAAGAVAALFIAVLVIGITDHGAAPTMAERLPLYLSTSGEPWLTMPRPTGWSVGLVAEPSGARSGGRREAIIANVPINDYLIANDFPNHVDWLRLPRDAVVVEMRDICGGLECRAAPSETVFPLRWADAQPLDGAAASRIPVGFGARQIVLRYFGEGHVLITYVGDRASASDRALATDVVTGIAPGPLPASGVVHDQWIALGPLSSLATDTLIIGTLPPKASLASAMYYVVGRGSDVVARSMVYRLAGGQTCTVTLDSATTTLGCAGRSDRWDRYGHALTAQTRDLDSFATLVRDGNVYMNFVSIAGGL